MIYENLANKEKIPDVLKCSEENQLNSIKQSNSKWECYSCNQNFTSEIFLCEHMVNVHEIDKPFKGQTPHICDVCDSAFNCTLALNNHMKSFHDHEWITYNYETSITIGS